jgi:hypothetical protein
MLKMVKSRLNPTLDRFHEKTALFRMERRAVGFGFFLRSSLGHKKQGLGLRKIRKAAS